jgi:hypothetical protein
MLGSSNIACARPARDVAVYSGSKFADWYVECDDGIAHRITLTGPGAWAVYAETATGESAPRTLPGGQGEGRHDDDGVPALPFTTEPNL